MTSIKLAVIVSIAVLFAGVLLLFIREEYSDMAEVAASAEFGSSATLQSTTTRDATSGNSIESVRVYTDIESALGNDALTQLLQELPEEFIQVSVAQQQAIADQLQLHFADFLATLATDPERAAAVRVLLEQALTEIAQITAALQSNALTASQLDAITDPNHLLNRISGLLEPNEITALEDQIQARAHRDFLQVVSPQVDILAPELSLENRALLLETFYGERSASAPTFGIGANAGPGANLDLQLQALNRTRDALRRTMTSDQFEFAENFLREQEKALMAARIVFSPLR